MRRFRKLLGEASPDYDYVFLDCAPSISLVSESVFSATDVLLVPTMPTTLSLQTLHQIVRFLRKHELGEIKLLPFYSMVDLRKALHRTTVSSSTECRMMATHIPFTVDVERMGERRAPLTSYSRRSPAALAFRNLWVEIQSELEPAGSDGPASQGSL